jgi:hypothetical protein
MLAGYRECKSRAVVRDALKLRVLCDGLWRGPYERAATRIAEHAAAGATWCKVKVPFAFDDDQEAWYEWVLSVASYYGYERRPGGSSGLAFDLVFFERTGISVPGQAAGDAGDEINGAGDDETVR